MYYKRLAKKYGIFLQDKNGEKIKNIGWLNGFVTERLRRCDFKKLCYITKIDCVRNNNKGIDSIPIVIPLNVLNKISDIYKKYVSLEGKLETKNYTKDNNRKKHVYFLVSKIKLSDENQDNINLVYLEGKICDKADRLSNRHNLICNFLLAIDNKNKATYYISCVAFDTHASKILELKVGDNIKIYGRIQSRMYVKKIPYFYFYNQKEEEILFKLKDLFLDYMQELYDLNKLAHKIYLNSSSEDIAFVIKKEVYEVFVVKVE